jgi:hypothetical protein
LGFEWNLLEAQLYLEALLVNGFQKTTTFYAIDLEASTDDFIGFVFK